MKPNSVIKFLSRELSKIRDRKWCVGRKRYLDSSLIANYLVPLIKSVKKNRQIIFATHNANFVVNGDSEKIFILKNDGTEFISYDNPRSIAEKSEYVINQGLGGIMFWEYGTDTSGELLVALKDGLNK